MTPDPKLLQAWRDGDREVLDAADPDASQEAWLAYQAENEDSDATRRRNAKAQVARENTEAEAARRRGEETARLSES